MNNKPAIRWLLILQLLPIMILGITIGCRESSDDDGARATSDQVSLEEATSVLNQAVAYASERSLEKLCGMGGSVLICQHQWADAGEWAALPSTPPTIIDTYLIPTRDLEDGTRIDGGRILVLEGVDGENRAYRTEFLVIRDFDSGNPMPLYPIYWSGISIAQNSTTTLH